MPSTDHAPAVSSDARAGTPRPRIAAVVFSLNEAELLPACLDRLRDFDDVVVCDMASEDETVAVAQHHGARVVPVPRVQIAEQVRQLALDALTTDWVIMVDADEHVPDGFHAVLVDYLGAHPDLAGVRLRYDNFAFDAPVPHALSGSAKYSLVRRALTTYSTQQRPHLVPDFAGPVADAPEAVPPVAHYNFRTIDQSLEKMLRYARNSDGEAAVLENPLAIPRMFLRDVVFSGAWRDGRPGVVVATLNVVGRVYGAALAWERAGYPDPPWATRARRVAGTLTTVQNRLIAAREALRGRGRR